MSLSLSYTPWFPVSQEPILDLPTHSIGQRSTFTPKTPKGHSPAIPMTADTTRTGCVAQAIRNQFQLATADLNTLAAGLDIFSRQKMSVFINWRNKITRARWLLWERRNKMADQEEPLLKAAEPKAGNIEDDTAVEGGVQGPILDLDMIITRLLSYKEKPGKQVHTEITTNQLCMTVIYLTGEFTRESDSPALCQISRGISLSTDAPRTGSSSGHLWRSPRTVWRLAEILWQSWISTWYQFPILGWLCRQVNYIYICCLVHN